MLLDRAAGVGYIDDDPRYNTVAPNRSAEETTSGPRCQVVNGLLRKACAGVVAVLVSVVMVLVSPTAAHAAGSCLLSTASRFDGWGHDPRLTTYAFEGASGYIVVRDGTPCYKPSTPSTNQVSSWVMIADNQSKGWVQVGFLSRSDLPGLRWFSQAVQRYGYYPDTWISPADWVYGQVGTTHAFYVLYDPTCTYSEGKTYPCEKSVIDNTVVAVSSFSPFGNWVSPFLPMFFGETKNMASDITGTASAKTNFFGLGAQKYDDTLTDMPCTMLGQNANPDRWRAVPSSCIAFDIWTAVP
jgi:hypothetical protein